MVRAGGVLKLLAVVAAFLLAVFFTFELLDINMDFNIGQVFARSAPQEAGPTRPPKFKCGLSKACPPGHFSFKMTSGAASVVGPKMCLEDNIVMSGVKNNVGRGINIALINGKTGGVIKTDSFDMWAGDVNELINFLKTVEDGTLVMMATFDDPASKDYIYYNDVHCFSLDSFSWTRLAPSGSGPGPRSACLMTATPDHSGLVVYGGYSKSRAKKDVDKGVIHSDMFLLKRDGKDDQEKWAWSRVSPGGGVRPIPRSGFTGGVCVGAGARALLFGGVCDDEDEETLEGEFFNDLYLYDITKNRWHPAQLKGTKSERKKRRRGKRAGGGEGDGGQSEEKAEEDGVSPQEPTEIIKEIVTEDGTVMTIREAVPVARAESESEDEEEDEEEEDEGAAAASLVEPCARSNAMATVKGGRLYLYGGMFEVGDKQVTLADLYSLDLHKMDKWDVLQEMDPKAQEWLEESDEEDEDEDGDEEARGGESEEESEEEESESEEEGDHPCVQAGESLEEYQCRTEAYWLKLARANMGQDAKDKKVQKVSVAMAKVFYEDQ